MRVTKLWLAGGAVVVALAGVGGGYRLAGAGLPDQKDPPPAKAADAEAPLKKAMLEEAKKVFEQDIARYKKGGPVAFEGLCQWSGRWLEAEIELAGDATARTTALKAHVDRMKEVEKMVVALAKAGQARESEAATSRYFRAQAELWLARGRIR